MGNNCEVSIVLVNYNTAELTALCIDSIFKHTKGCSFEVILVDNNSSDGSKEIFSKDERIQYIYNDSNCGFGAANNIGAMCASGKYLFFLNTDTLLIEDAITTLASYMGAHTDVVVCGGNLLSRDHLPTSSFERIFPSIWYELNELFLRIPGFLLFGKNQKYNYSSKPLKVAYVSGADLMIRRKDFSDLKGFDSNIFMYVDETELCMRASKIGSIVNVPSCRIIHYGGQSNKNSSSISNRWKLEVQGHSLDYVLHKYHTKQYLRIFSVINFFVIILKRLFFFLTGNKALSHMWKEVYDIQIKKNYKYEAFSSL